MSKKQTERFTIVVTEAPGWGDLPGIVRVRRLLKAALRQFGLRCVEIRPADAIEAPAADSAGKKLDGPEDTKESPRSRLTIAG